MVKIVKIMTINFILGTTGLVVPNFQHYNKK